MSKEETTWKYVSSWGLYTVLYEGSWQHIKGMQYNSGHALG